MQEEMDSKGGEDGTGQLSNKAYQKLVMTFYQEHPELSPQFSHHDQAICMFFWLYPGGCFLSVGYLKPAWSWENI